MEGHVYGSNDYLTCPSGMDVCVWVCGGSVESDLMSQGVVLVAGPGCSEGDVVPLPGEGG